MKWLSKIASSIVAVAGLVSGLIPLIQGVIPQRGAEAVKDVSDDLTKIAGMVVTVEAAARALETPLPGDQKLAMVTPLVAQVVLQSDALHGKKIKDPELFKKGCAAIGSGMADVLNSIEES